MSGVWLWEPQPILIRHRAPRDGVPGGAVDDNVPAGPMGQLMFEMYKSLKGTPKRPRWSEPPKRPTPPPRPPIALLFFGMVFGVV